MDMRHIIHIPIDKYYKHINICFLFILLYSPYCACYLLIFFFRSNFLEINNKTVYVDDIIITPYRLSHGSQRRKKKIEIALYNSMCNSTLGRARHTFLYSHYIVTYMVIYLYTLDKNLHIVCTHMRV
ncbi:unnamed protein product [Aphis gossypii]|uniref:Uncharacterized protein n=1 Tax=Aphis gossypii TaxID=80765 RepID=A0A9P0ND13_APHGO|nr:unnamed protein product [Aphis gossypii]